jgi:hypothetical protein
VVTPIKAQAGFFGEINRNADSNLSRSARSVEKVAPVNPKSPEFETSNFLVLGLTTDATLKVRGTQHSGTEEDSSESKSTFSPSREVLQKPLFLGVFA